MIFGRIGIICRWPFDSFCLNFGVRARRSIRLIHSPNFPLFCPICPHILKFPSRTHPSPFCRKSPKSVLPLDSPVCFGCSTSRTSDLQTPSINKSKKKSRICGRNSKRKSRKSSKIDKKTRERLRRRKSQGPQRFEKGTRPTQESGESAGQGTQKCQKRVRVAPTFVLLPRLPGVPVSIRNRNRLDSDRNPQKHFPTRLGVSRNPPAPENPALLF